MTDPADEGVPGDRGVGRRWFRRRALGAGISLLIAFGAGGCADDDSGRRFANQPVETEVAAVVPTAPVAQRQSPPPAPAASPIAADQLLRAPGTAETLFAEDDGRLFAYAATAPAPRQIFAGNDGDILAFAGSPNGDRVAVLVRSAADAGPVELHIVTALGDTVTRVPVGDPADPARATPIGANGSGAYDLAWSPAGDRIAVALAEGGIVEVSDSGEARTLLDASRLPAPRAVSWSPAGNAIAFVDAIPEGATGLHVAATDVLPPDPAPVIAPVAGRSRAIVDISWPAGGNEILYVERAANNDLSIGGDLFAVPAFGGSPRLVASSGIATPISAVGSSSASADGTAIAFSVIAPGQQGNQLDSLWVKQRNGPTTVRVPIDPGGELLALAWSADGLMWMVTRTGSDGGREELFQRLQPDGFVTTLYSSAAGSATPQASPAASPVDPSVPLASPPAGG